MPTSRTASSTSRSCGLERIAKSKGPGFLRGLFHATDPAANAPTLPVRQGLRYPWRKYDGAAHLAARIGIGMKHSPPPTRYGAMPTTAQAKAGAGQGRAALAPPTRYGPPAPAVQSKGPTMGQRPSPPSPPPPPTRYAPSSATAQAKPANAARTAMAPPPTRYGLPATAQPKTAPRHPAPSAQGVVPQGVVQRHIIYNSIMKRFESNGKRPGDHLSLATMTGVIQDLLNNNPVNSAEEDFKISVDADASGKGTANIWTKSAQTIAQHVINNNVLSNYGYAVCHKTPYISFEWLMLEAIKDYINNGGPSTKTADFKTYLTSTIGGFAYWTNIEKALKKGDVNEVELYAKYLGQEFDKQADNLFIGYKETNSSVSNNADLHFNSLSPLDPAPSSPRGNKLLQDMQTAETSLFGSAKTKPYVVVDGVGDEWTLYSGLFGTKKTDSGYVHSK
jgi:hypothetical protein